MPKQLIYEKHVGVCGDPAVELFTVLTADPPVRDPLLVIHGGPDWDHTYLRDPLFDLADHRDLIFPDLRGCGRSSRGLPDGHYTPDAATDDLVALLDVLGVARADVLGFSYGGLLAQRLALAAPGRVRRLVIASSAVLPVPADAFAGWAERDRRTAAETALWSSMALSDAAACDSASSGVELTRAAAFAGAEANVWRPEVLDDYRERLAHVRFSAEWLRPWRAGTLPPARPDDAAGRLAALGVPILLLHGRQDMTFPAALAERAARLIPSASAVLLDEAGHMAHVDRPGPWLEAVSTFLRRSLPAFPHDDPYEDPYDDSVRRRGGASSMTNALPVTLDDVHDAAARLKGVAHRTPVLRSRTLDALVGAEVFVKCENFQRVGAFKFRGAYNAVSRLTPGQLARGIAAYSSGNHAQAVALAARELGSTAVIVMPEDAPRSKMEATAGYGAEIVTYDRYTGDRVAIGEALAAERGLTLIPPYEHPHIIAGQGTAALELIEDVEDLDALVVAVGGGGLIAGSATAAKGLLPRIRVIGVEPEAGDDTRRSLAAGERVSVPIPRTIADGLAAEIPGELTFSVNRRLVDEIVLAGEDDIRAAMRFAFERMKIVIEPSGATSLAALLSARVPDLPRRVGLIISGGNIDTRRFAELCGP
ncbi:threo-3-hydroxy-L-aspartate ammonia-lyase [Nonomuraea sp. NPDC004297]